MTNNLKVKVINISKDSTNKVSNNFKVKTYVEEVVIEKPINEEKKELFISPKVGDKVQSKSDDLFGRINDIKNNRLYIKWEDNVLEKIKLDFWQEEVEIVDNANDTDFDNTINDNVIDDSEIIESMNIQHQLNIIEHERIQDKTNQIKDKLASEIIDMAIMKGLVDADDKDVEMMKVLSMDDDSFSKYQKDIVDYDVSGDVTSRKPIEDENLTEAEKMLKRIKGNGGKGFVGDFSKEMSDYTPSISDLSYDMDSDSGKRDLSSIKMEGITFNNQYTIPSYEDHYTSLISDSLNKQASKHVPHMPQKTVESSRPEVKGFENLKGLTKPLIMSEPVGKYPTNSSIKDLFSDLNWTIFS